MIFMIITSTVSGSNNTELEVCDHWRQILANLAVVRMKLAIPTQPNLQSSYFLPLFACFIFSFKKEFPERKVTMEIFPKTTKKLSNSWLNPWRTLTFETVRESIQKGDFILFGHRLLNKIPLSLFYCNLLVQNPDGGSPRCYLLSLLRPLVISGELRNSWRNTCWTKTPTPVHGSRTVWPKSCLQIATECLHAATLLENFLSLPIITKEWSGYLLVVFWTRADLLPTGSTKLALISFLLVNLL